MNRSRRKSWLLGLLFSSVPAGLAVLYFHLEERGSFNSDQTTARNALIRRFKDESDPGWQTRKKGELTFSDKPYWAVGDGMPDASSGGFRFPKYWWYRNRNPLVPGIYKQTYQVKRTNGTWSIDCIDGVETLEVLPQEGIHWPYDR